MKRIIPCVLLICIFLSGCATQFAAKMIRAIPEPIGDNYGEIVVIRPAQFVGSAAGWSIFIDNYVVDTIGNGTYEVYKLPPNAYNIYVYVGNAGKQTNVIRVNLKKGETVYLQTLLKWGGWIGTFNLFEINEDEAKVLLSKMKKGEMKYKIDKYPEFPLTKEVAK